MNAQQNVQFEHWVIESLNIEHWVRKKPPLIYAAYIGQILK